MTTSKTILLTGAFGNVGEQLLGHLCAQQHQVTCFDVQTPRNEKKATELQAKLSFQTIWGDLRQEGSVVQAVQETQPDTIAHIAAVIPPVAYSQANLAYDVNVNGTAYLIKAAKGLDKPCHFIFTDIPQPKSKKKIVLKYPEKHGYNNSN